MEGRKLTLTYTRLGKTITEKIDKSISKAAFYTYTRYCGCEFISITE